MKSRLLFLVVCLLFFTLMVIPFESSGHTMDIYVIQMSDKNPMVRRDAAENLVRVSKTHAEEVLPLLIEGLKDEDKHVRRYIAMALGTMGKPAVDAVPALIESLPVEKDATVRSKIAELLGKLGKSHAQTSFQRWWVPLKMRIHGFVPRSRRGWVSSANRDKRRCLR